MIRSLYFILQISRKNQSCISQPCEAIRFCCRLHSSTVAPLKVLFFVSLCSCAELLNQYIQYDVYSQRKYILLSRYYNIMSNYRSHHKCGARLIRRLPRCCFLDYCWELRLKESCFSSYVRMHMNVYRRQ